MGTAEQAFADRVAERLTELGTTPFAVEKAHNLPADTVRSILRGFKKSGTTLNSVQAVCDALDLELYIGPRRTPDPEPPTITLDGDEFSAIPKRAIAADAGAGRINDDAPEVVGKLAFRRDWLRKIGVRPDKAMLVTVAGDSMAPGLERGDLALIDQARASWVHNSVFALVDVDGGVRIKRILLDKGRALVLLSDNPDFAPEVRTGADAARVKPLGQVVWSGHKWG